MRHTSRIGVKYNPNEFLKGQTTMSKGVVRLHRVLKAPAERVYRAFLDGDALCRWLPPHGFLGKVENLDPRVGGGYRMSFRNFGTGHVHAFRRYIC